MEYQQVSSHIVIDPEVCHGQLTFRNTRIPVDTVLDLLAKGYSIPQLLQSYPELSHAAIEEVIHLAADSLSKQYGQVAARVR